MTTKQFNQLTAASALATTDVVPIQQSGTTAQTTIGAILAVAVQPNLNTQSGSTYTAADTDVNGIIDCTNSTSCTVTVPNTLTKAGTITIRAGGTGTAIVVAGSGVTIDKPGSRTTISERYDTMALLSLAANHWTLMGATS
jgi:hypothetical protein